MKEQDPGEVILDFELDTREALLGSSALSELSLPPNIVETPVLAEALRSAEFTEPIPDRIELPKQEIDLSQREKAERAEARRLRLLVATTPVGPYGITRTGTSRHRRLWHSWK